MNNISPRLFWEKQQGMISMFKMCIGIKDGNWIIIQYKTPISMCFPEEILQEPKNETWPQLFCS